MTIVAIVGLVDPAAGSLEERFLLEKSYGVVLGYFPAYLYSRQANAATVW
jgi:hypothetical protein